MPDEPPTTPPTTPPPTEIDDDAFGRALDRFLSKSAPTTPPTTAPTTPPAVHADDTDARIQRILDARDKDRQRDDALTKHVESHHKPKKKSWFYSIFSPIYE